MLNTSYKKTKKNVVFLPIFYRL